MIVILVRLAKLISCAGESPVPEGLLGVRSNTNIMRGKILGSDCTGQEPTWLRSMKNCDFTFLTSSKCNVKESKIMKSERRVSGAKQSMAMVASDDRI